MNHFGRKLNYTWKTCKRDIKMKKKQPYRIFIRTEHSKTTYFYENQKKCNKQGQKDL